MAKKKKTSITLEDDLQKVNIPFDLLLGVSIVTEEVKDKGFKYKGLTQDGSPILTFKSKEENVTINIEKENLLIRQFSVDGDSKKLKAIYVVKPSERKFNLI